MPNEALQQGNTTILVDPLRRWTLYSVAAFLIAVCVGAGASTDTADRFGVTAITLIAMSPALFFLIYVASRTRLVLSASGIHSYNIGVSARVTWDEIQRISLAPGIVGIVLKRPSDQPGMRRMRGFAGLSVAGAPYYSDEQRQLISEGRFIDLRAYRRQLNDGEFIRVLKSYAPAIARATSAHHDIEAAAFESQQQVGHKSGRPKPICIALIILGLVGVIATSFLAGMGVFDNTVFENSPIWHWLGTAFKFVIGVLVAVLGIGNVRNSWRQLKTRRYATGAMWLLFGIAQALIGFALIATAS